MAEKRRSRARRVLGVIGGVVGIGVTFVSSVAAGVVLHLDVPATRRLVATQVNGILASTLSGKVEIEKIGGLGLRGIDGVRVRVRDPEGVQVLYADDVRVRVDAIDAARSALFEKGPIRVGVSSASIERVDAVLDVDAKGDLRIAKAFEPKKKEEEKKAPEPPGRGVKVEAPKITLKHAWVRGTPAANAPAIDADLDELVGHAHVDPHLISADLDRVGVAARKLPRGLDPNGTIVAHYSENPDDAKTRHVFATYDGTIAGMPATLDATMKGDRVDARFDTFDASGDRAAILAAELPQHEAFSLHAEAHGTLPYIDAVANVKLGEATVDVVAKADTSETKKVNAKITARHIDLQALAAGAPPSDLGLDGVGELTAKGDDVQAKVAIDTLPGTIENDRVPKVQVRGDYAKDTATVRARIHEATMPTEITAALVTTGGKQVIDADVRSSIPDLRRVPKVGSIAQGSAAIDGHARLELPAKSIDAKVTVVATRLAKDANGIERAKVEARARGTIDAPTLDVQANAEGLHAGAQTIEKVAARARVAIQPQVITVTETKVDAVRHGMPLAVSAELVRVEGSSVRVKDAVVDGLGEPIRASLTQDPSLTHVVVSASKIDLAKVAQVAEVQGLRRGTAAIDSDLALRHGNAKGTLRVSLDQVSAKDIENGKAKVDVSIDGRAVLLDASAELAEAGRAAIAGKVDLGGPAMEPNAWKRAAGSMQVSSDIDLGKVTSIIALPASTVSEVRGRLVMQGRVARETPEAPPEVQLHAHTLGLYVAGPAPVEPAVGSLTATEHRTDPRSRGEIVEVKGVPSWKSVGVDLGLDVRTDARSGQTGVAVRLTDKVGAVAALDAKAILPYDGLVADPSTVKAKLVEAPISARLVVPERPLALMPSIFAVKNARGKVDADLTVEGTALEPKVHLVARGRGVKATSGPLATDADVDLTYDGKAADLTAHIRSAKDKRPVLDLTSHVDVRARDAILRTDGALAWKASSKVKLATFPLASIPQLADRQVKGDVTGEATLEGLHDDARVNAKIDLQKLEIGNAKYTRGTITASTSKGKLEAGVRLEQTDGYLDARASTGLAWGKEIAPKLDTEAPVEAHLQAKAFRAAAAAPFVENVLGALDGRIDANANVKLDPKTKDVQMDGQVVFRDGTVHVAAIGAEFRSVRATATMRPDGTIEVKDVYLRGIEGEVRADATAKLDGLRLVNAKANINVPKDKPLDLAVQGQPIGEISGKTTITATGSPDGKKLAVVVDVPELAIELPQTTKGSVQELEEKKTIRVGTYRDRTTFVRLPMDKEDLTPVEEKVAEAAGTQTDIDVRLGRVFVQRGNSANIVLTGNPKVAIGGQTKVTGQIQLQSGWADVQGKKFEIEKGAITFNGESPPNPVIVLTAGWTAYDATRIYADFVGPVKTGKVTLRSEPPRPKNEILAIILFGTADGANPTPAPTGRQPDGTTKAAMGLGGGFAAQGLTEALDDLAGIQASARIDTTRSNNPRPEVELQVAPRLSVSFSHVVGTPPITAPDKNLASIDWRFRRNWSLETTVGDRGRATVDAIWQKRY